MSNKFINFLHQCLIVSPRQVGVKAFKTKDSAILPTKAHTGMFEDAAYDLYATEDIFLQSNQRLMVDTYLSFIIPSGYWLKLRERSGLANKGIHILGGVIDSGYTGTVRAIMYNSTCEPVSIPKDKAICQFTVEKLTKSSIEEITAEQFKELSDLRHRGEKGFGSSDKKDLNC